MTDPTAWLGRYLAAYARLRKLRRAARAAVNNAIRDKRLVRPTTCSACGGAGPIEAHHVDYRRPIDVVWLCRPCHLHEHRIPTSILPYIEPASAKEAA